MQQNIDEKKGTTKKIKILQRQTKNIPQFQTVNNQSQNQSSVQEQQQQFQRSRRSSSAQDRKMSIMESIMRCDKCSEFIDQDSLILLQCHHSFHFKCLLDSNSSQISQGLFKCCQKNCQTKIIISKIERKVTQFPVNLKEQILIVQLDQFCTKKAENISICPTYNCWFFFIRNSKLEKIFMCPLCLVVYCFHCKKRILQQYNHQQECFKKQESNFKKLFSKHNSWKFKQCPFCLYFNNLGKNQLIKCTNCQKEYRYDK